MSSAQPVPCTTATGIDWLRGLVEARGASAEEQLVRALGADDHAVFRKTLAMSWVPEETALRIYEAAGQILFAGEADVLFEVGRGMARANMTTIYKALIRLTTIPYVLSQAARLWRTYHDRGTATAARRAGANEVVFAVADYPDFIAPMRLVVRGYLGGLAELLGVREYRVVLDEAEPKWTITWR